MRAYSLDLRERVLAALEGGMSRNLVSTTFKVSHSTIKRWLARRRSGQPLSAPRPSGRTPIFSDSDLAALHSRLQAAADASIAAHTQWWNHTHPERPVSPKTIERAIARLGWTRKKSPCVPANAISSHEPPSASGLRSARPPIS
jgi:transposase